MIGGPTTIPATKDLSARIVAEQDRPEEREPPHGGDRGCARCDRQRPGWDGRQHPRRRQPAARVVRELCRSGRGRPDVEHPAHGCHDHECGGACGRVEPRRPPDRRPRGGALSADAHRRRAHGRRRAPQAWALHPLRLAFGHDRLPDRCRRQHHLRADPGSDRRPGGGRLGHRQGPERRDPSRHDRPDVPGSWGFPPWSCSSSCRGRGWRRSRPSLRSPSRPPSWCSSARVSVPTRSPRSPTSGRSKAQFRCRTCPSCGCSRRSS